MPQTLPGPLPPWTQLPPALRDPTPGRAQASLPPPSQEKTHSLCLWSVGVRVAEDHGAVSQEVSTLSPKHAWTSLPGIKSRGACSLLGPQPPLSVPEREERGL